MATMSTQAANQTSEVAQAQATTSAPDPHDAALVALALADSVHFDQLFDRYWGERGSGDGQFTNPQNSILDGLGNIYVTDTEGGRIQKFRLPEGS